MTHWIAVPFIEDVFDQSPSAVIEGDHKTVSGRINYIQSHGVPGIEYAVALEWPTGGWVAADSVTVPADTHVSSTTKRGVRP
jgi:hypothetical protein